MSSKHYIQIILSLTIVAIGFIWSLTDVTFASPRKPRTNQELLDLITTQYPNSYHELQINENK